ncbi:MAG TPA: BON domain-containing protein [Acetobacteraceae bacterium]|nr:BON domain-containing protein [Acetobacteraceae bacterium]
MTTITALMRNRPEAGSEGIRPADTAQPDASGPSAEPPTPSAAVGPKASHGHLDSPPDRIPVYRAGELAGFVRRSAQHEEPPRQRSEPDPQQSSDARMQRDIEAAVQNELGPAAAYIRMSVAAGIVGLSGEVANVHDKLALRRIAASIATTVAIVDEVWISCE